MTDNAIASLPGLRIESMPPTAFVPEVPHARVKLENVFVPTTAVSYGDAYTQVVKPFRTIEDIHVHAASIAYLVAEARRRAWPQSWLDRAVRLLRSLAGIARLNPLASETHVELGAALETGEALVKQADRHWAEGPNDAAAARWLRDRALFSVAAKARSQRLAAARSRLDAKAGSA